MGKYTGTKYVVKGARGAVEQEGKTADFLLTAKRDKAAARRFFEKAMRDKGVVAHSCKK